MRALRTYCFSADTENSILSLKIPLQQAGCDLMIMMRLSNISPHISSVLITVELKKFDLRTIKTLKKY